MIILLVCVTQLCHAQYTGGSSNGNYGGFTAAVFMGAGSNGYAGGVGDGFHGVTATAVALPVTGTAYIGGNGDGFYFSFISSTGFKYCQYHVLW